MAWRARTIVQQHRALRASRPQLKRDPLGSRVNDEVEFMAHHNDRIDYIEFSATDIPAAKAFYSSVVRLEVH